MKINVKSYSSTSSLLFSIIFLVLGSILMTNADNIITWVSYIIGALLILIGLFRIFTYYSLKKKLEIAPNSDLIFGIVFFILGIVCFFLATVFETVIRFIIGTWVLFCGVQRLVDALKNDNKSVNNIRFMVLLIVSIALILIGLYIILYSNLLFKWIGLLVIIYSILEIIGYIFFYQTNKNQVQQKKVILEHKEKE